MASRLLSRSKALALALSRAGDAAVPPAAPGGARWLRAMSSLHRDSAAAAAAPAPRQPTVGSPLGLSKITGYEQSSRLSGTQVLPRWFSTGTSNGSAAQQEVANTKVTAFSPLEASIAKPRSGPLTTESFKVRRSEQLTLATFYMIPALLLVSKNSISTSLLVATVFHQVYMFHKEIFLDYIHHDITRKWVLIYFKLLLIIMAKEAIVYFDLF